MICEIVGFKKNKNNLFPTLIIKNKLLSAKNSFMCMNFIFIIKTSGCVNRHYLSSVYYIMNLLNTE